MSMITDNNMNFERDHIKKKCERAQNTYEK